MGQRVRMNSMAFILRLREDWIYWRVVISSFSDSLIFQSCRFCSRFFWVTILKSERFFSSVNRWSGKDFGASIDVLHEAFKIAHTYTFLTKKIYGFDTVLALWFWDFPHPSILYAYYADRKFCHKYTRALSPVWNRPHIRALYARKISPRYIWELRCVWNLCERLIGRWYLGVRLYHVLYMRSSFG